MDRRVETKVVKGVLARIGITGARVKHGTGTGWGWLHVYLPAITTPHRCIDSRIAGGQPVQELTREQQGSDCVYFSCLSECPACIEWRDRDRLVTAQVLRATCRVGDYDGRLLIQ